MIATAKAAPSVGSVPEPNSSNSTKELASASSKIDDICHMR